HAVIRSVANIFVVMTSLVIGLMINSAKNTFEAVDHNVHDIATEMILLDRALMAMGPQGSDPRQRLLAYAQHSLQSRYRHTPLSNADEERLLNAIGESLRTIKPETADQARQLEAAEQRYVKVVQLRWILVEQSEGQIPRPILILLVAWLVLIFASFG